MEQKDRSCECNNIKNEIRADMQTYFDSMLKFLNARINTECLEDGNKKLKELQEAIKVTDQKLECVRSSVLTVTEYYIDSKLKNFELQKRKDSLIYDQIDKLYYIFFANSVCILLLSVPTAVRFVASFFEL